MKKLIATVAMIVVAQVATAQSAFQLSLVPDVAIVPRGETVKGVALNLWGENEVQGFNLGFVNGMVGDSWGFSWSLFGGAYAENYTGVIWGSFFSWTHGDMTGWQASLINVSGGEFVGLQSGAITVARDVTGVQLGFVNYTEQLKGVQVGLVNIVSGNEWFTEFPSQLAVAFPFVNWSF